MTFRDFLTTWLAYLSVAFTVVAVLLILIGAAY